MEIAQIKSKLSLQIALSRYNLSPDRNNRLCCPWHNDKTPSLQIYPETNTWTCFSSNCNAGSGDVIDFIMKYEKITKREAILKAKELINTNYSMNKTKPVLEISRIAILTKYYQATLSALPRSKKAIEYAKSRNLDHGKLGIGYSGADIGRKWNKSLHESGTQIGVLQKSGENYRPKIKYCLMFAMKNREGKIVDVYGRSIASTGNNKSRHFYLSGKQQGLYPNYPKSETTKLILTESIIDAASLAGQANTNKEFSILALYGTNGFTEEHGKAIKELELLEEVIFFFDGDEAGNKAIETYSSLVKAMRSKLKISKVETSQGEDVNSLVQSHEPEILNHLIKERTFLFSSDPRSDKEETSETKTDSSDLDVSNTEYIKWSNYNLDFTVIGGVGLYPLDRLKVTLRIKRQDSEKPIHSLRQTIDLYQDDLIEKLARKIAERLEIGSSKIHESLLELTGLLERYREIQNEKRKKKKVEIRELTPQRIETAQAFLSAKDLDKRTNKAIGKTGLIGEVKNRMILWYVFTSRLRKQPLHAMCLGASGTGKTYLQEKIGALIPKHQKKEITAMSDNAMYYFDEKELVHKLLLIEDLDGANEQKILYALRELMSKKYISKTIVIKDSKGNLKTITLEVRGPICLAGTTTRERLYEDNSNRSLLIYLDNSKAQRQRIMDYQRKESAGKINKYEEAEMVEFMQDVQSVLKPIKVVNPYAEQLIIPEQVFKPLRTNSHYLQFIESVTFYHQYQRVKKQDERGKRYIETTIEDIEIANELLKEVLLAKSDELTKASRRFYEVLQTYLKKEKKESFYSGEIRRTYRMTPATVKRHLRNLVKYGYVKTVGGSKNKGYEYEVEKEVDDLRNKITTALDAVLNKIKSLEPELV